MKTKIAENIKFYRKQLGLTQGQLAEYLHGKKSLVRLARTGDAVGAVVNYLHPDDKAYSFSGQYLCSPSMVRHPEGHLLSSMDLFDYDARQCLTLIFRSDDDGKSWKGGLLLDERSDVSYPDGDQGPDGRIYVVYDRDRLGEQEVLMACFTAADLLAGKLVDHGSMLKKLVTSHRGICGATSRQNNALDRAGARGVGPYAE